MPNQNNALSIQSLGDSKKQKLDICFFIVQNSFTWDMSCVKSPMIFFVSLETNNTKVKLL